MKSKLLLIMLVLILNSSALATDFYSGNQYKISVDNDEKYVYQWSASSGNYQENDKNTFIWTAPDVTSPTEVVFSVLVKSKTCECYSDSQLVITVCPRKEIKLETESISNSTNITNNERIEMQQTLTNNTEYSNVEMPIGNDTLLDPVSERPNGIIDPENSTCDALSGSDSQSLDSAQNDTAIEESNSVILDENGSDNVATVGETSSATDAPHSPIIEEPVEEAKDQSNQEPTEENPLATEMRDDVADTKDQSAAEETCTLSFGDGIDVNVVFDQSTSLAETTVVIIEEAVKEIIGSGSSSDGTNTLASLTNTTLVPESGIDQSGANINQTKAANVLPEIIAGSTGKTDETPEQSNTLEIGSEVAVALHDPNENPPEQAINQTTSE